MGGFLSRHRFPLHVHIATLFITLILCVGLGLGYYSYTQSKKIVLEAADQLFDQVVGETALNFQQMFSPIQQAVKLVVHSPVSTAQDLPSRMDQLPLFLAALADQSYLTSLYAGYVDGDYFVVRQILTDEQRKRFDAPATTQYVIDHVETESGTPEMVRVFLDRKGFHITEQSLGVTDYDPRIRPWYGKALLNIGITSTAPYQFYFSGDVGITLAQKNETMHTVIAADITLEQLSLSINQRLTESAVALLYTADSRVLAYNDLEALIKRTDLLETEIATISELEHPLLNELSSQLGTEKSRFSYDLNGDIWEIKVAPIRLNKDANVYLAIMAPEREILADAIRIQQQTVIITLLILLVSIPIVWWIADRIAAPLRHLAEETRAIEMFDFESPIHTRTIVLETAKLADAMQVMKRTIHRFLELVKSLSAEQNFDKLLQSITKEIIEASQASAALVYLLNDEENLLQPGCFRTTKGDFSNNINLKDWPLDAEHPAYIYNQAKATGEPQIFSLSRQLAGNHPELLETFKQLACDYLTVALFPLINRNHETIGILVLFYEVDPNHPDTYTVDERYLRFTHALSSFTALSMENKQLIQSQKDLLAAFIKLIAGAIDAKSPYTGGHCQRVPELTRMLAQAACDSESPPFASFQLEEESWEALHIASWMHDCGKVTTPEYVVDKATKLETLNNRIHEIRTRFEVLKRDAEIDFWKQLRHGGDEEALRQQLSQKWKQIDDDFAFVAKSNLGSEFLPPEAIERLEKIAELSWQRTMDDRLGLSWEELKRKTPQQSNELPAEEKLLSDKPEHIIHRLSTEKFESDNPWGFKLEVPKHKLDSGELHNLSVIRGTLTGEERYIINDHITQTIMMLEQLPYPRHLKNVPQIAGGHHEKMDGTGYPRQLYGKDMPLTARIMAIADIYEALTASDRPYKKAKTISEAIKIMGKMRDEQHIDKDLFALFLKSGIYQEYGRRFLAPEQIDEVKVEHYL